MVTGPAAAVEASIGIDAVSVKTASAVISYTFVDICTCKYTRMVLVISYIITVLKAKLSNTVKLIYV